MLCYFRDHVSPRVVTEPLSVPLLGEISSGRGYGGCIDCARASNLTLRGLQQQPAPCDAKDDATPANFMEPNSNQFNTIMVSIAINQSLNVLEPIDANEHKQATRNGGGLL